METSIPAVYFPLTEADITSEVPQRHTDAPEAAHRLWVLEGVYNWTSLGPSVVGEEGWFWAQDRERINWQ